MAIPPISATGAEWQIKPITPSQSASEGGSGFGAMLDSLSATQAEAAKGAQALAAGTADDPTAVVMAVERAQLSMQLASQIRTKLVEAAQDIFHTQV
jgi:flagellar hook-basal body complex protein FliE